MFGPAQKAHYFSLFSKTKDSPLSAPLEFLRRGQGSWKGRNLYSHCCYWGLPLNLGGVSFNRLSSHLLGLILGFGPSLAPLFLWSLLNLLDFRWLFLLGRALFNPLLIFIVRVIIFAVLRIDLAGKSLVEDHGLSLEGPHGLFARWNPVFLLAEEVVGISALVNVIVLVLDLTLFNQLPVVI